MSCCVAKHTSVKKVCIFIVRAAGRREGGGGRSDCVTGELRIQFGQKRRGKNLTSCRRSCFRSGIENLANKEREKERAGEVSLIFVSFKEIKKKKKKINFFLRN